MMELDIQYYLFMDYDVIYNRIRYLVSEKTGLADNFNDNYARIRIGSFNSLPRDKTLTFHNVIMLIKSVVNKNEITTNMKYFQKKVYVKTNPIHNNFK